MIEVSLPMESAHVVKMDLLREICDG